MSKTSNKLLKALLFIGTAAGAVYCFNQWINDFSTAKNKLRTKKGDYYEWKYGNVYYQKSGSGDPILLIHDYSHCSSSYEWKNVVDSLSETNTVYTIDLLGCGRSEKPQITYTNFLYVQLITDFIQDVIGEKTTIISSGFTSSFAIMAAAYNKLAVNKLVLVNPVEMDNLTKECTTSYRIFKDVLELPLIGTFIYNLLTTKTKIDNDLTENYIYNPFNITSDMIDTYYEAAHLGKGNGKFVLSSYLGNYLNANIAHGLKNISNEILVILGGDETYLESVVDVYKELNENVHSVTIPKTKRIPHLEKSELFIAELNAILNEF